MVEVINNCVRKARKEYYDDGWDIIQEWIRNGCYIEPQRGIKPVKRITFSEGRFLIKVRRGEIVGHKILPNQLYQYQFNKMDGDAYYWRTKKEFYELICKYELWPDD
jgi:hypothetical protein